MTTETFALADAYPIITSIGCGLVAMRLLDAANKIRNRTIRHFTYFGIGLGYGLVTVELLDTAGKIEDSTIRHFTYFGIGITLGMSLVGSCSTRVTYINVKSMEEGLATIGNTDGISIVRW